MRLLNRILKEFGVILVPRTSAKMLNEVANVYETGRRSGGQTARWLRLVAELHVKGGDEYRV